MWKLVVGFIVIAGLALFLLSKGGDIDLGGEKHGALPAASPFVSVAVLTLARRSQEDAVPVHGAGDKTA